MSQLDKQSKQKVILKGGNPFYEMKVNKGEVHQDKKGFEFLRMLTQQTDEAMLTVNVKPFAKLPEIQ